MATSAHSAARQDRRGGFTLLEVMIALAILAVSLVAVAGINASAIDMHAYSKRLTVATMLARSKMADIETKLMSEDLPADDSGEEGSFEEDGFPEYKWKAEIIRPKTENVTPAQLLSMAGLDSADPSKSGSSSSSGSAGGGLLGMLGGATGAASAGGLSQGQGSLMSAAASGGAGMLGGMMTGQVQTMIDLLGKSVREVHLTVSWQTGKTVDKFTVVTHVVSFGRDTAINNSDPAAQAAASGSGTGNPAVDAAIANNPNLRNLVNGNRGVGNFGGAGGLNLGGGGGLNLGGGGRGIGGLRPPVLPGILPGVGR
ncbi:MAG TPA: prepilin-type N-terminal cleavage/methylation domain-containing protein [Myxococcales bacterium]